MCELRWSLIILSCLVAKSFQLHFRGKSSNVAPASFSVEKIRKSLIFLPRDVPKSREPWKLNRHPDHFKNLLSFLQERLQSDDLTLPKIPNKSELGHKELRPVDSNETKSSQESSNKLSEPKQTCKNKQNLKPEQVSENLKRVQLEPLEGSLKKPNSKSELRYGGSYGKRVLPENKVTFSLKPTVSMGSPSDSRTVTRLYQLLPSLHEKKEPNLNEINELLNKALYNNIRVPLELINKLEFWLKYQLSSVHVNQQEWTNCLQILDLIKYTYESYGEEKSNLSDEYPNNKEVVSRIVIELPPEQYSMFQKIYTDVVEMLRLLEKPNADVSRLSSILETLVKYKVKLQSNILELIKRMIETNISWNPSKREQWQALLYVLPKILVIDDRKDDPNKNKNGSTSTERMPDKWGINSFIDEFKRLEPVSSQNRDQYKYAHIVLLLLKSPNPDTKKIYKLLGKLREYVELNSDLLSVLMRAINKRLVGLDFTDLERWKGISDLLEELQNVDHTDENKLKPDKWKITAEIKAVLKISLLNDPVNEKVRNSILEILDNLKSPKPDKMRVLDILLNLENVNKLHPKLLVILTRALNKRVTVLDFVNNETWKKIFVTLVTLKVKHKLDWEDVLKDGKAKKWNFDDETNAVLNVKLPDDPNNEMQRNFVLELLQILQSAKPDKQRILEIFVHLESTFNLHPSLHDTITRALNKRVTVVDFLNDESWRKVFFVLENLKRNRTSDEKNDPTNLKPDKWGIDDQISLVLNVTFPPSTKFENEQQRQYVLEVLRLLRSLNPEAKRIHEILLLLKSRGNLNPTLLLELTLAVNNRLLDIDFSNDTQWMKVLTVLNELNHGLPESDVWGISLEIDKVLELQFPSSANLENEKQRQTVLKILEFLKSTELDKTKILEHLDFYMNSEFQLDPNLLVILTRALNKRLLVVNLLDDKDWRRVLVVLVKLNDNYKVDWKDVLQDDKPKKWDFTDEINAVLNIEMPANNEQQRKYVVHILEMLQSTEPDVERIIKNVMLLESKFKLDPSLLEILTQALNKRVTVVEFSKNVYWQKCFVVLEKLKTNENSEEEDDPNNLKPDKWGISDQISLVLNVTFPSSTEFENEYQRQYVLEILQLLHSLNPDPKRIYEILLLLNTNVQLHPTLLLALTVAVKNRLVDIDVTNDPHWSKVLAVLNEFNNGLPKSDEWDISLEIDKVLELQFPSSENSDGEKQRQIVLEILELLKSSKLDKKTILENVAVLYSKTQLDRRLLVILTRALNKRLVVMDVLNDEDWKRVFAILVKLKLQYKLNWEDVLKDEKTEKWDFTDAMNAVLEVEMSSNPNNEEQRKYVIEVLGMLQSTKPDVEKVLEIVVLLESKFKLHPSLVVTLTQALNKRVTILDFLIDENWRKVFFSLDKLKTNYDSDEVDDPKDVKPDKWGINDQISLVLNLKFSSMKKKENEKLRLYVLKVLRQLQSLKPNEVMIYEILLLLKTAKLHPTLLEALTLAIHSRLLGVEVSKDSPWMKVLAALDALYEPAESHYSDKWGVHYEIDKVLNYKFTLPPNTHGVKQSEYVLAVLQLLQSPKPNKRRIHEILVLLKNEDTLHSTLLSILKQGFDKRLYNVKFSQTSKWNKILLVLEELENMHASEETTEKSNSDLYSKQVYYKKLVKLLKKAASDSKRLDKALINKILVLLEKHYKSIPGINLKTFYKNLMKYTAINWLRFHKDLKELVDYVNNQRNKRRYRRNVPNSGA